MQYWKFIGEMQRATALGQIDSMNATVVLSQYFPAPPKGHFSKIQHIYGYFNNYTWTSIKFNIETSYYDNFKTIEGNWGKFYAV